MIFSVVSSNISILLNCFFNILILSFILAISLRKIWFFSISAINFSALFIFNSKLSGFAIFSEAILIYVFAFIIFSFANSFCSF
jgi:hypothetical protein